MTAGPVIGVVDHGAGNLVSISQGLERVGATTRLVTGPGTLGGLEGLVLPGVGSTAAVMAGIRRIGLEETLGRPDGPPLLGICVGMQVLFEESEEDGAACLGILPGRVERLRSAPTLPHIGWNDLQITSPTGILEGLDDPTVYFVHSYAPRPSDPDSVTATAFHGEMFVAAVASGVVSGVQFHPERSGGTGLRMLARFVRLCRDRADAA